MTSSSSSSDKVSSNRINSQYSKSACWKLAFRRQKGRDCNGDGSSFMKGVTHSQTSVNETSLRFGMDLRMSKGKIPPSKAKVVRTVDWHKEVRIWPSGCASSSMTSKCGEKIISSETSRKISDSGMCRLRLGRGPRVLQKERSSGLAMKLECERMSENSREKCWIEAKNLVLDRTASRDSANGFPSPCHPRATDRRLSEVQFGTRTKREADIQRNGAA